MAEKGFALAVRAKLVDQCTHFFYLLVRDKRLNCELLSASCEISVQTYALVGVRAGCCYVSTP